MLARLRDQAVLSLITGWALLGSLPCPPLAEPRDPVVTAEAANHKNLAPREAGREITGRDGAPMVLIPEGVFLYGEDNRSTWLPAFYIDTYEVSARLYAAFLQASGRLPPHFWSQQAAVIGLGDRPVVYATWHEAGAYCRHYGKRLPTEEEWEKAARGTDGRKYPWGNEAPTHRRALYGAKWTGFLTLATVDSYEAGKSPYGVYNMAGNVMEWTSSDNESGEKVVRGGSWLNAAYSLRVTNRNWSYPTLWNFNDPLLYLGFRCAQDPS